MPNFRTLLPGFVKQMQYNVLKIKTAAKQRVYPKNQATQKILAKFSNPKKSRNRKFQTKKKSPSLEIRRTSTSRAVKLEFPIGWITKLKKRIPSLKCDND